jgi:hypothetical protein
MPGLFNDFNPFRRPTNMARPVRRGNLIAFNYPMSMGVKPGIIHDPYPLVIITDIWPEFLRGVNLHYLTFPDIKSILQESSANPMYSYANIKPKKALAEAFRVYNRRGMHQIKMMDIDFLLNVLGAVRSWSPSEINAIENQIQAQIRQQLQTKAQELTAASQQFNQNQTQQINAKAADIRQAFQPQSPIQPGPTSLGNMQPNTQQGPPNVAEGI